MSLYLPTYFNRYFMKLFKNYMSVLVPDTMPNYCCVKDCYLSKSSKHRFPNPIKDMTRFHKWLLLCGNNELRGQPSERVYSHFRVCADHFLASDFGPNNVLLKTAIPSLKLPGRILF